MKLVCNKCDAINKVAKVKKDYIYCIECGNKIEISKWNSKKTNNKHSIKKLVITLSIIILMVIIFLVVLVPVRQYSDTIYTSNISKYCKKIEDCKLNKSFKEKIFSIYKFKLKNSVVYDGLDEEYEVVVEQFGKEKIFKFKIVDDLAPVIKEKIIELPYDNEFVLDDKITINDYIDGKIKLDDSRVTYDASKLNTDSLTSYDLKITVIDNSDNKLEKILRVKVIKQKPTTIKINLNDSYLIGETIQLNATVLPSGTYDKTLSWFYRLPGDSTKYSIESNTFVANTNENYTICAVSNMDNKIEECKYNIYMREPCKSYYEFNFNGAQSGTIGVGDKGRICTGKYRIYAYFQNSSSISSVAVRFKKVVGIDDFILLSYYNNVGLFTLTDKSYIEYEPDVTKIVLQKVG